MSSAAIFCIGTEITSGQILNRNAQWISQRLLELGIGTHFHLSTRDDRENMLETLKFLEPRTRLLFLTGGLGPTTDDFTRDVVASWTGKKMLFDDAAWEKIVERFRERNLPLREMQKQQCYFPEGSQILNNRVGTAQGFWLKHLNLDVFILPGPPKEIECIWEDHLASLIPALLPDLDPLQMKTWNTTGLGESEIAHLLTQAHAEKPFEIGYRAYTTVTSAGTNTGSGATGLTGAGETKFVEVKIIYLKSQESKALAQAKKVEETIRHLLA